MSMQFSWTTFIIEIINFLILVWILKRLLYMPIKNVINKRKQEIQETLANAAKLKQEAKTLEDKYNNRLNDWEEEKQSKRKQLETQMQILRNNELTELKATLEKERTKNEAIIKHRIETEAKQHIKEAMALGAKFSAKLLNSYADPELESKIINNFIASIAKLSESQRQTISTELFNQTTVTVQTAFSLDDKHEQEIVKQLQNLTKQKLNFDFKTNSELLAGLNIQIGAIILRANLRDELDYFVEVAHGSI